MARILIIDDEDIVLTALQITLEKAGHQIDIARDGEEGIERFNAGSFDLVITDIIMPRKTGLTVIAELTRRDPSPRIIAISGGGRIKNVDMLEGATAFGATRVLEKPFTAEALLEVVDACLDSRT